MKNNNKTELKKGQCPSCWGKGFYTQMYGIRGADDFGGEGFETKPTIHKKECPTCKGTGKEDTVKENCECKEGSSDMCNSCATMNTVKENPFGHNLSGNGEHRPDCIKCSVKENDWIPKLYRAYYGMIDRCTNKKGSKYHLWGGRGIKCEWKTFEDFKRDMYDKFLLHIEKYGASNTSLDRIDNNGNYNKNNCRWATREVQGKNKRNNSLFTHKGQTLTVTEWSEKNNIKSTRQKWSLCLLQ